MTGLAHDAVLAGFAAACAQHESDHLDGIVTLRRLVTRGARRAPRRSMAHERARRCLPYADRRLHTPAAPVAAITETVRMIWADMVDTMEAMPGCGLAAPQIGIGSAAGGGRCVPRRAGRRC